MAVSETREEDITEAVAIMYVGRRLLVWVHISAHCMYLLNDLGLMTQICCRQRKLEKLVADTKQMSADFRTEVALKGTEFQ